MQEEKSRQMMAYRYCGVIDSNVVVLSRAVSEGGSQNICLCAHLCEKDRRMRCPYHSEKTTAKTYF